jgi:YidC/Oxa1 family membrane protein insertase
VSALDPLNVVVAWVIIRIHTFLGGLFGPNTGLAWGLSIAILVIAIRILLVPLFVKQVHAQRKMAQHAPYLQELRKKYKGDKQRLNEETMKFYKENGVNPLAGCLPMIPQMIVFFALFSVLRAIAEWKPGTKLSYGLTTSVVESAQKATIFGVHLGDKLLFSHQSVPAHVAIVIAITVALSATTTFMTVRQSAKRGLMQTSVDPDNPMAQSQKYMMYIVPFFSLTGLYWQYGLVLYWVTTNLWTLGQQFFMFRNWTVEPTGAAAATAPATASTASTGTVTRTARPAANRPAANRTAPRPGAGTAKTAAATARTGSASTRTASSSARTASSTARPASATARTASSSARPASSSARPASSSARPAPANGRTSASSTQAKRTGTTAARPAGTSNGASAPRTGSAAGDAAAASAVPAGQNGDKRGLLTRFGRQKQEPEPVPDVPATKVVRQQPQRQARSKRSGKR